MKLTRLTAAVIAAATAITPLSFNASAPISYAVDTGAVAKLPDWIPSDFDSAVEFRNSYGATHIDNGLICLVYPDRARKGRSADTYGYELKPTAGMGLELKHEIYTHELTETCFDVFVYQPQKQGDIDLTIVDPHVQVKETPDDWEPPAIAEYSFTIGKNLSITETDIFSWLPDSMTEYDEYTKKNGNVSVNGNYVVFCTMAVDQLGDRWEPDYNNKYENIKYLLTSDCTMQVPDLYDDGSIDKIYVYQAVKDGYEKISWIRTSKAEPTSYTLTADCAVLDNAQTILLSGDMRVTLVDYDTSEPLTLPEGAMPRIWTDIRQSTSDGEIKCNMQPVGFRNNPDIVGLGNFFDGYNFSFGLLDIPESYSLPETEEKSAGYYNGTIVPEDHITVKKYDNNTADVVFKLKKNSDVTFSYNAHSLFSDEIIFNWADSNAVKAADSHSAQISSSKELAEFLKKYLSEQAITPYLKKYDDKFFEENVLLLYTYIDPYNGRIYDHEFAGAALDGNTLKISFTSSVGHAVCKTYHFEVMQAVISKEKFKNYTVEWNPIEVFDKALIKITFVDADTDELLKFDEIPLDVTIGYLGEDGVIAYADTELTAYMNPYFCGINYQDADVFELGLFEKSLPKGYKLADDYKKITKFDNGSADVVFKLKFTPTGDVNDDGEFNVADVVLFQKWLLGSADANLINWKIADFCNDNVLNVFDLCLMRKALVQMINIPVAVSITETGGYAGVHRVWKVYKDNEKYILSYDDQKGYVDTEPIIVEISEADYSYIMSLNYGQIIDVYNKTPREQVWDGFNYKTVLTYGNGEKIETSADMTSILMKLEKLLDKYLSSTIFVEPDKRTTNGSPLRVMVDDLKLYSGPNESYQAITLIPEGARLYELGYQYDNDKWLFTQYKGQYGWIKTIEDDNSTVTLYFEQYVDKPVIYLYPEQETDVHVELELTEAELSTTYPKYNNGWDVTAYPDGKLVNKADGTHHRYLFWDAVNCRTRYDFSKGFCVAGSDTESFLKEKLTYMGLTEDEMNEFIVYWLPLMEHNKYNLISFQSEAYTDSAKLNITPAPDSMLRVFMAYVPLEEAVDVEPQQLSTFERTGFTVVEWGGSKIQ